MPKGKKKGKYEHRRTEQPYSSDEDAGIDMTCSETSERSDFPEDGKGYKTKWYKYTDRLRSHYELYICDNPYMTYEREPTENELKLEEKVLESVEALNARAAAARAAALEALRGALQRRHLAHVLAPHRLTLTEHVARALRRGRDPERRAAAALAPLLALQVGEEGADELVAELRPALAAAAVDRAAALDTRTECCSALAVLCFLLEEDFSEILEVMRLLEGIFSGSYLKGDGSARAAGEAVEEGAWHAAALEGWALLLAAAEPAHAAGLLAQRAPSARRLAELLDAPSVDVRVAAGGALCLARERAPAAELPELLPRLERLARDSHKHQARRARKLQRATFRDVLRYFEEGALDAERVRVAGEALALDSWAARAAYGALAGALGGGLAALVPHAPPLRRALRLEPLPAPGPLAPAVKLNRLQRHLKNTAACKARTVARNKSRDKRSAALAL